MNVGALKPLSYLTSFGLLGAIGYIGYDYFENGKDVSYFSVERADTVLNGVKATEPPKRAALDYVVDITPAIVEFNWTGKPPEERQAVVETGPEDNIIVLTPVSDILDVLLVVGDGDDPGESFCVVQFHDATISQPTRFYEVGSTLPPPNTGISVARITGDGVIFSFADRMRERELVLFSEDEGGSVIVSRDDPSLVVHRKPTGLLTIGQEKVVVAPAATEKRNGQYYLGTDDVALFNDNFGEMLTRDVTSETYYDKDGKRAGIKLTSVRAGSTAAGLGAQSGDVIIAINGSSVNSKQEAIQFVKNNSDRYSVWEVQVMNLGRVRTEVYHSQDN